MTTEPVEGEAVREEALRSELVQLIERRTGRDGGHQMRNARVHLGGEVS